MVTRPGAEQQWRSHGLMENDNAEMGVPTRHVCRTALLDQLCAHDCIAGEFQARGQAPCRPAVVPRGQVEGLLALLALPATDLQLLALQLLLPACLLLPPLLAQPALHQLQQAPLQGRAGPGSGRVRDG